jgi:hypothetical protein
MMHLTPSEVCFGRKPSVSHLSPFDCKCSILKHGNLDKFESRSSDDILLRYTPHGRSYRDFIFETNTVVESCDVSFDKTAPSSRDDFECAGDKEIEESIFVDEGLHDIDSDEDEQLLPQATTSSTTAVEASWVEGEIFSELGGPFHIQKTHPPQQIIGNLNEKMTRSSRSAHLSCFTNTLFVALFEP